MTRRLIALLVSAASFHHQPSASMAWAAATKRSGNLVKVAVVEVVAEDESSGADPAHRQAFGSQVVLKHPVVAAWLVYRVVQTEVMLATRTGKSKSLERAGSARGRGRSTRRRVCS